MNMLLILLISLLSEAKDSCSSRSPVIFVPGLMASIIEARINVADDYEPWPSDKCDRTKDWFRSWVDIDIAVPWKSECYLYYLHGVWNSTSNKLQTIPGIDLRVPRFGSTYSCDQLVPVFLIGMFSNSFHKLIEHLEKVGYEDEIDMFGAGYDWRSLDLEQSYYEGIKGLIYEGFKNTGKKTVIISHSMGGLVTYKLLDYLGQEFCDKYLKRWIAVSAPFIGTGMVPKQLTVGENLGLPIKEDLCRSLSRSIQSVLALAQDPELWPQDVAIITIKSTGKQYFAKDMQEFYKTIPEICNMTDYVFNNRIGLLYKKYNYKVPFGVEMDCVYSHGKETPYTMTFETEDTTTGETIEYSDGDQLVNDISLHSCSMFTDKVTDIGKHGHLLILNSDDLWEHVLPLVCENDD